MARSSPPPGRALFWACGLCVAVVGSYLLLRSTEENKSDNGDGVEKKSDVSVQDPAAARRAAAHAWFQQSFLDAQRKPRRLTAKDIARLMTAGEEQGHFAVPGIDWAARKKRVYRALLTRAPHDPAAHRHFGRVPLSDYPDFYNVFRALCDARIVTPEAAALRKRYEDKVRFAGTRHAPAVTPAEFKRVTAVLDRHVAYAARLATDPTERAIATNVARIRLHPLLGKLKIARIEAPPFVLLYAETAGGTRHTTRLAALRKALVAYQQVFATRWAQPLGLRPVGKTDLLFAFVFGDRIEFDEYTRKIGLASAPHLRGYFYPRDHWVYLFDDPEAPKTVAHTLAHELTHQLHWFFSRTNESGAENYDRGRALWFAEGWAEYTAMSTPSAGPAAAELIAALHALRGAKLGLVPLRKFVTLNDRALLKDYVSKQWLPQAGELNPKRIVEVTTHCNQAFYAQAWLLLRFLHDGADGQRRTALLDFTRSTLRGYAGLQGHAGPALPHEAFAHSLGLTDKKNWDELDLAFGTYVRELLTQRKTDGS